MSLDIAIAGNGDLILAAGRDLQPVTGAEIIAQRIRTRLKIHRGSWVHDSTGALGSRVHTMIGKEQSKAVTQIPMFVREALGGMDDVEITNIQVGEVDGDIAVVVYYTPKLSEEDVQFGAEEPQEFAVTVDFG